MPGRCIAHLDMDAFYVSVELRRRPELRGLPVIVAGTGPRAVVTTASYEARRYGVGSAMPAARARRLCPDGVYLAPDFAYYRSASREVMGLVRACADAVEVIGLDEAYLDLTGMPAPRAEMRRLALRIERGDGTRLLDRDRPQQAGGQSGLRRREAARLRRPHPRAGVRALRRGPLRSDPGDRAEDRRAPAPVRPGHARASSPPPRPRSSPRSSARGWGPSFSAGLASRMTPR